MKAGTINPRNVKMRLAREIITMYHSPEAAQKAQNKFELVFSKRDIPEDIPEIEAPSGDIWLPKLLADCKMVDSTSEGRRMLKQGAIKVNGEKYIQENIAMQNGMVIQVGKRKFVRIKC